MSINLKLREQKSRVGFDDKQNRLQSIRIKKKTIPYQNSMPLLSKNICRKHSFLTYAYVGLFIQKLRIKAEKSMYRKMLLEQWLKTQISYKNDLLIICNTIKYPIIHNDYIKIVNKEKLFFEFQQLAQLSQKMENILQKQLNKYRRNDIQQQQIVEIVALSQSQQIVDLIDLQSNDAQIDNTSILIGYHLSGLAINFSIYSEYFKYLKIQQKIIDSLETNYPTFFKQCQKSLRVKLQEINPHKINMGIRDTIQQPLFRILKYVLLIKKYIKLLPQDHPDSQNMRNSLEKFGIINQLNNSLIKKMEKQQKKSQLLRKIDIQESLSSLSQEIDDVSYVSQFNCHTVQGKTQAFIFTTFLLFAIKSQVKNNQTYRIMKLDHLSHFSLKSDKKYYKNSIIVHGRQFSRVISFQNKQNSYKFCVYLQKILKNIQIDYVNKSSIIKTRSLYTSQVHRKNRGNQKNYKSYDPNYDVQELKQSLSIQVTHAQVRQLRLVTDYVVFSVKISINQFDTSKFAFQNQLSLPISVLNNLSSNYNLLNAKLQEKIVKSQILTQNISYLCKQEKNIMMANQISILNQIFPQKEQRKINQILSLTWQQIQDVYRLMLQKIQINGQKLRENELTLYQRYQSKKIFEGKTRSIQTKCILIQQFLNKIFRSPYLLIHAKEIIQKIGIKSCLISYHNSYKSFDYINQHQKKCQQCKQVSLLYDIQQLEEFQQRQKSKFVHSYEIPLKIANSKRQHSYCTNNQLNKKYQSSIMQINSQIPLSLNLSFFQHQNSNKQRIKQTKNSKIELIYKKRPNKQISIKYSQNDKICFQAYRSLRKVILQSSSRQIDSFNRQLNFFQYWDGNIKFSLKNDTQDKEMKTYCSEINVPSIEGQKIIVFINDQTRVSQILTQIEYILGIQQLSGFGLFIKLTNQQRLLDQHQKAFSVLNKQGIQLNECTSAVKQVHKKSQQIQGKGLHQVMLGQNLSIFGNQLNENSFSSYRNDSKASWTIDSLSKILSKKIKPIICLKKYIFHPAELQLNIPSKFQSFKSQTQHKYCFKREQLIIMQFFCSQKLFCGKKMDQKLKLIILLWLYARQLHLLQHGSKLVQSLRICEREYIKQLLISSSFKSLRKILAPLKNMVDQKISQRQFLQIAQKHKFEKYFHKSSILEVKKQLYEECLKLIWNYQQFTCYQLTCSFNSIEKKLIQRNDDEQHNSYYSALNASPVKIQQNYLQQSTSKNDIFSFEKGHELQLRITFKSIIIVDNRVKIMQFPLELVKVIDRPYSLHIQFYDFKNKSVITLRLDGRLFLKIANLVQVYQFLLWKFG